MLAVSLGACSRRDLPGASVATVNGKTITDYQISSELAHAGTEPADVSRTKALQSLIDRQLLQSEALRNSIDRDPNVVSAIENAKAQILAQAYLQSRVAYAPAPSSDEISAYFSRHPEQFSKHKLFYLKEIVLPSSQLSGELKAVMDQSRSLDDVAAWLEGRRILYMQGRQTRSSADMPEALLARMQGLQAGQILVVREGDNASLLAITDIQESPVTLDAAAPQIRRILLSQKGRELGDAELARLRASAKVEYADGALSPLAKF